MPPSSYPKYRLIEHTSDLGIVVFGANLEELFKNSAEAMLEIMLQELPDRDQGLHKDEIEVSGVDLEDLMVCWLGEILFLVEADYKVPSRIEVISVSDRDVFAYIWTVPLDPTSIVYEIKAVTYHEIEVCYKGDHWEAKVIFDL